MQERSYASPSSFARSKPVMAANKHVNKNAAKPVTPALSSHFHSTKSPLPPRITASTPSSPLIPTTQESRARTLSPGNSKPLAAPFNGNITPRSAARALRTETESPSTPGLNRDSPITKPLTGSSLQSQHSRAQSQGLGITTPRAYTPTYPLVKPRPKSIILDPSTVATAKRRISTSKSLIGNEREYPSKFFHADDARSEVTAGHGLRAESPVLHLPAYQPPVTAVEGADGASPQISLETKFFRANDVPVRERPIKATRPELVKQKSSPSLNVSGRSPPSTAGSQRKSGRAKSPAKVSPRANDGLPAPPKRLQPHSPTIAQSPASTQNTISRRKSVGSPATSRIGLPSHRKSVSAGSLSGSPYGVPQPATWAGPSLELKGTKDVDVPGVLNSPVHLRSAEALSPRSASLTSGFTAATSVSCESDRNEKPSLLPVFSGHSTDMVDRVDLISPPLSPSQQHQQHAPATHARQERKVLDLEISNSSLLAINKTLERELRKQNIELRRFRRLSRAGRLSLVTSEGSVSGQSAMNLDPLAESDEDAGLSEGVSESDDPDGDESLVSDDAGSLQSTTAKAAQRARDEKRLVLDLSRHQRMLLDSQKLSQAISRCTNYTEDMIKNCNKALEYKVGIGDVYNGGRVLSPDDLDEKTGSDHGRQGLLSPSLSKSSWIDDIAISSKEENAVDSLAQSHLGDVLQP